MDGGAQYNPRTVEEVFRDFKGRRAGMIKALTSGSFPCSSFSVLFYRCFFTFFFLFQLLKRVSFLFLFADVEEFYQQCDPGLYFFSFYHFFWVLNFYRRVCNYVTPVKFLHVVR